MEQMRWRSRVEWRR